MLNNYVVPMPEKIKLKGTLPTIKRTITEIIHIPFYNGIYSLYNIESILKYNQGKKYQKIERLKGIFKKCR
jgi:hypothetical protein